MLPASIISILLFIAVPFHTPVVIVRIVQTITAAMV